MTDAPVHRFGRYELVGLIGRGGMGEVWHGRMDGAAGWKKDVAIKRLLPHLAQDTEFLSRFLDEGRLAASLSHGNIAAIFDMGEVDGEHFVAMEYVDGLDLRDALRRQRDFGRPLPVEVAVLIASELCKALEYAHTRSGSDGEPMHIVHRDVSPSNVLLSRAGEVKLVDFGIAAARSRAVRTLTGQLRGKLSYMSPEQAAGGKVDARSDIFALGAVLYEMLSGQRALDGASEPEILARVQAAEYTPLDRVRPELDPELVAIVHRAMARQADDRFPSADALGVALLRFLMRDTGPVTQRRLASWVAEVAPVRAVPTAPAVRRNAFDALLDAQRASTPDSDATRTASGPVAASASSWPGAVAQPRTESGPVAGYVPVLPAGETTPAGRGRRIAVVAVPVALLVLLTAAVVALLAQDAPIVLQVSSSPSEARVYVDGIELGTTPLRTRIEPAAAEVRLAMDGYRTISRPVESTEGSMVWSVELQPLPTPVVFESVPPGASVRVDDGEPFVAGNAVSIEPGVPTRVQMRLDGYETHDVTVNLEPGISLYTARLEPLATAEAAAEQGPTAQPAAEPVGSPRTSGSATEASTAVEARPERSGGRGSDTAERVTPTTAGPIGSAANVPTGQVALWFPEPPMVGDLRINGSAIAGYNWQDPLQLPAGTHEITVANGAYGVEHRSQIVVEPGTTTRHMVTWQPR